VESKGLSEKVELDRIQRWDDFRVLIAIAQSSSIKGAGEILHTTQSAVSKRLDRLECGLGVKLFDRGPRGAKLTYQGEKILCHAIAAQSELSRAVADAHSADSRIAGDCSLLVPDGIANCWIAPFLTKFYETYPNIDLKLFLDHDIGAARNQAFDIRLHYYEPIEHTQVTRPIADLHFIPQASRSYIARRGLPTSASDLENHRIVDQAQHLVARGSWASWFDGDFLNKASLFTNQSGFVVRAVLAGVGIGLMPTYLAALEPELVPIDIGMIFPAQLYASYHRERIKKGAVKTTMAFLRNEVFDQARMPWFQPVAHLPDHTWPSLAQPFDRRTTSA
jgi:DNA-binding transcriptional LysR family regulator